MTRVPARDRTRSAAPPADRAAGQGSPGPAGAVLALQRSAGNAAVNALLARVPAPAATEAPAERLRRLLRADDEEGAITYMASLSADEAGRLLADEGLRALAVKAFDDEQMTVRWPV